MWSGLQKVHRLGAGNASGDEYSRALVEWEKKYELAADEWCHQWATSQLGWMDMLGGSHRMVAPIFEYPGPPEIEPPALPNLSWRPSEETRESIQQRFDTYLDRVEHAYRSAGFTPVREKRQREHFWWLAAYQIRRFSYSGLADALGLQRHTIELGVIDLAKKIDLTLRDPASYHRATPNKIREALNLPDAR